MTDHAAPTTPSTEARIVGSSTTRVWGLSPVERLSRHLAALGVPIASADGGDAEWVVGLRGDHVYEPTLVDNLVASPGAALCTSEGALVAFHVPRARAAEALEALEAGALSPALEEAVGVVRPHDLAYNQKLRKRATPYVLQVTDQTKDAIERRIFAGSYKGVTDLATKYLFPWPVRQLTRVAAALRLRPNHVTSASFVLTVLTTWLFHEGRFGWGLVAAWGMCLLDSVDGKLARVTLTSSKLGDVFDHGIDLVHPPFWYWAFMAGLGSAFTEHPYAGWVFYTIMVLYVAQRLLEGLFIAAFGLEMHVWRPFDSAFRLVTARRNPNLLILTAAVVIGRPLEGIVAVAAWTAASFLVHLAQVAQAAIERAGDRPIDSWLKREAKVAE